LQHYIQEAEVMKKTAEELKVEAEAARVALVEAENKLEEALKEAEEAKASESTALNRIKELSERTHAARASTSESGGTPAKITISKEEFDSLSHKVEEAEKLSDMKVAAAMAQVEAVRASENEAIRRLEAARKEMEEIETATEEALKRAEMAEAAKKAVEGELKRWREKEQKRTAEAAARILAESQQATPPAQPVAPASPVPKPTVVTESSHQQHHQKKKFQAAITSIFHKRKGHSHTDASSASYLPGERRA
jgi:chromosome segregation ATPase